MKVCIVTGGIGSGKSTVCSLMNRIYGCPVYDADSRAKDLYVSCSGLLTEIEKALGLSLRDEHGQFMPSLLAGRIFSDASALKVVENLLFPVLLEDFNEWKAGFEDCGFVVFESATVLEKEYFSGFGDITLLVDAPVKVRAGRAAERDGVSESLVKARMDLQPLMNGISEGMRDERVDYIIANDSSLAQLELRVRNFLDNYLLKNT